MASRTKSKNKRKSPDRSLYTSRSNDMRIRTNLIKMILHFDVHKNIRDKEYYNNYDEYRPDHKIRRIKEFASKVRSHKVRNSVGVRTMSSLGHRLRELKKERVCFKRKIRRIALFSSKSIGSGIVVNNNRLFNQDSTIHCK